MVQHHYQQVQVQQANADADYLTVKDLINRLQGQGIRAEGETSIMTAAQVGLERNGVPHNYALSHDGMIHQLPAGCSSKRGIDVELDDKVAQTDQFLSFYMEGQKCYIAIRDLLLDGDLIDPQA